MIIPAKFHPEAQGYLAETLAWVAAVGSSNVTTIRKTLVNNLISGLKGDAVWTKLDRLWVFAAENAASAVVDLVGHYSATVVGSPTFTTDRSYSGFSNANYLNTKYSPSTSSVALTSTSSHCSAWIITDESAAAGKTPDCLGASISTPAFHKFGIEYVVDDKLTYNRQCEASSTSSTTWSKTLDTSTTGWQSYSARTRAASLSAGGTLVRVRFVAAASGAAMAVDHCSIGIQGSATAPSMVTDPPMELTFNGGQHGFSIAAGATITSDWAPLTIASTDTLIVDIDFTANAGNDTSKNIAGDNNAFYKVATANYATASVSGYTQGPAGSFDYLGCDQIEVQNVMSVAGRMGTGLRLGTRTGANALKFYKNASIVGEGSSANSTLPALSVFVGTISDSAAAGVPSTASVFANGAIGAISLGGGFTDKNVLDFYTRLRTYMTAVGVP